MNEGSFTRRHVTVYTCTLLAMLLVYWLTNTLSTQQRVVLATLTGAVILWIAETIPLFVTALLSSFLLIAWGGFSAQAIFAPYFDPVIVLFLGGFMLARGLQKFGVDARIAEALLNRLGPKPNVFLLGLMIVTAFLSLWMSNTAAAAIMIPICLVVLQQNELGAGRYARSMVLAVAYAATIGGLGSLVGSPPNAIAAKYLREQGEVLSFLEWMQFTLPFVCIALVVTWLILCALNRPEITQIQYTPVKQKIGRTQIITIAIFALTVLGWLTTKITGLSSSTVALLPILAFYVTGLFDERDLQKISWSTLLLFGGGLSLGAAISAVGLDQWLAAHMQGPLSGLSPFPLLVMLIFFGIFVTMIASNTASAAILIPLMLPMAASLGISAKHLAIILALGVSLDFMMPVGTPPSAIAYSTGLVRVRHMVKNGILVNLSTGLLLAILFFYFM